MQESCWELTGLLECTLQRTNVIVVFYSAALCFYLVICIATVVLHSFGAFDVTGSLTVSTCNCLLIVVVNYKPSSKLVEHPFTRLFLVTLPFLFAK